MNISEALVELQDADLVILRTKRRFAACDEYKLLTSIKSKLHDASVACGKLSDMKAEVDEKIDEMQGQEDAHKKKLAEIDDKIDSSKDMRAIANFNREKEGVSRRLEKVQFQNNEQLERLEKIEAVYKQALSKRDELDAALVDAQKAYKAAGEKAAAEVKAAQERRNAAAALLPKDLLARYAELVEKRGGIAVGTYDGMRCSACNVEFNEGERVRIERGPDITVCPGCGRMLVVR